MKFLDEKGRVCGKISIVDILVILLCLLVVVSLYGKYHKDTTRTTNRNENEITYTVKIKGIQDGAVNVIKKGDLFRENIDKNPIGKVIDIQVEPATMKMNLNDGTLIDAPWEKRYDVLLTLETKAEVSDGFIYLNHVYELNVNSTITLLSKYVQFTGVITKINI